MHWISRQRRARDLETAELQFRLAAAVRLASSDHRQPRDLPIVWSHGQHTVGYEDIAITEVDADRAAHFLLQTATFLLAAEIRNVIVASFRNPKDHRVKCIRSAYQIARLIRNAFAHRPFAPTWSIDHNCRDQVFSIRNTIRLDTHGLDQKRVDWRHYGGPLALLSFARWVRHRILKSPALQPSTPEPPQVEYYQQGRLFLRRLK